MKTPSWTKSAITWTVSTTQEDLNDKSFLEYRQTKEFKKDVKLIRLHQIVKKSKYTKPGEHIINVWFKNNCGESYAGGLSSFENQINSTINYWNRVFPDIYYYKKISQTVNDFCI